MKAFLIDWRGFLGSLEGWEALSVTARRTFLMGARPGLAVDPEAGGEPVAELAEAGYLMPAADPRLLTVPPNMDAFHHAMGALGRIPLFDAPTFENLQAYLAEHYSSRERSMLHATVAFHPDDYVRIGSLVTSVRWLEDFRAEAADPQPGPARRAGASKGPGRTARHGSAEEEPRRAAQEARSLPGGRSNPTTFHATPEAIRTSRQLLTYFMETREHVPLRSLEDHLPGADRDRIADALKVGIARVVFFLALRTADLEPLVGIWPATAKRLFTVGPSLPPGPVDAAESFRHPFLVEDMTSILLFARRQPIRVRRVDGKVFSRPEEEMRDGTMSLPAWLENAGGFGFEKRMEESISCLKTMKLLASEDPDGEEPALVPTERSGAWLGLTLDARAEKTAKVLMARALRGVGQWDNAAGIVRSAVLSAFSSAPQRAFLPVSAFLDYQSANNNPLTALRDGGELSFIPLRDSAAFPTDEVLEERWSSVLSDFLLGILARTGGVETGVSAEGGTCFRLTDPGRRLLGMPVLSMDLPDDGACTAPVPTGTGPTGTGPAGVIVQPNFEIVFLAPAPAAEAEVARFSERLSRGLGVLFRLTKHSVYQAAASGLAAADILDVLHRASSREIPSNVEHEIGSWLSACRRFTVSRGGRLVFGDEETAARALSAAGKALRRVSATEAAMAEGKELSDVAEKLLESGLFPSS